MSGVYVVGYDHSDGANRAVDFALERARASGSAIKLVHVLEWSPYSFLTPEELDQRHKRRQEELARAETQLVEPVVAKLREAGIETEGVIRYGHVADVICEVAREAASQQIIVGRTGGSGLTTRIFGSVPNALIQSAPVAVTVVP